MFKSLMQPSLSESTSRQDSVMHCKQLAKGVKLWMVIDLFAVPFSTILFTMGLIPLGLLSFLILFAVGCPIIMIIGLFFDCLRFLTIKECYEIVKSELL